MNLTEQFDKACKQVGELLSEREKLIAAKTQADTALSDNDDMLRAAIRERDSMSAALSVAPEPKHQSRKDNDEETRLMRQAVFANLKKIPNVWIAPQGVAILSGVDSVDVCDILRRAANMDGMPVEHNGKRGVASKYRWIGNQD